MSDIPDLLVQQAIAAALDVRGQAYCPYSRFSVGAALITAGESIITGCNVENASYSLTNCAERVAVQNAIVAGQRDFGLLVVASSGAAAPCGACRQVLAEFAPELEVLLVDAEQPSRRRLANLGELLPQGFSAKDLPV